ncbi:MAG: hypothetical protein FMNOHCHN_02699 [Ignavibacteriaceae bacterium]|nr:hypothetical protein [Ignavibacteriaceae bacterium]
MKYELLTVKFKFFEYSNHEPRTKHYEPRTKHYEPRTKHQVSFKSKKAIPVRGRPQTLPIAVKLLYFSNLIYGI